MILAEQGIGIFVEPTTGIEPVNLFLTKEVLYLLSYVGTEDHRLKNHSPVQGATIKDGPLKILERETGLEPATFSLEG